ncbi:hypothetical protein [Actinocorallia libanotica]|uniref:Uncharacterized protein n=1 Tax=Actinocorallia libanotica TaxID=46162 RepID=A0ABN1Q176_9ACTN
MRVRIERAGLTPCPIHPTKARYRRKTGAILALSVLQHPSSRAQSPGGKVPCRVYKCPACSGWHLTSQPERKREE